MSSRMWEQQTLCPNGGRLDALADCNSCSIRTNLKVMAFCSVFMGPQSYCSAPALAFFTFVLGPFDLIHDSC